MTEQLLHTYKNEIEELKLIPSSGGRYEVTVDDQLIFSKAQAGRHSEPDEILAAIERREPVPA